MFRPAFHVVSGVLATLCLLALIASALRPQLPPAATNMLSLSSEDFLKRAAHQAIDWQELSQSTVSRARREGRPILLVVGVVSSGLGQRLDETVLQDDDVARYIDRNFVPVRVDGLEHPEWLNAFFPIFRTRDPFLPGMQIWILTPSGQLVGFIGRSSGAENFDVDSFYQMLLDARRSYDQVVSHTAISMPNMKQRNEVALLASQSGSVISPFALHKANLQDMIDPAYGGLTQQGLQQLFPNSWRFMCQSGMLAALRQSLNPLLQSPMMDLLDGGFFRVSTRADYSQIEFNKVALEQAEMLLTLSIAWRLTNDPLYLFAARNVFRGLFDTMRSSTWFPAFQIDDAPTAGRSARYSFSTARLRLLLNSSQRSWAAEKLGLDVLRNPQMVPFLTTPSALDNPKAVDILQVLQNNLNGRSHLSGLAFLEVQATVLARTWQAARLLQDRNFKERADGLIDTLNRFVSETGLRRRAIGGGGPDGYLGDYLAFSDAMLQDYLGTGRQSSFEAGKRILLQAVRRFKGARAGEYVLSEKPLIFPNTDMPEIADNFRESCSARLMRLLLYYGRLLADTATGEEFLARANEISNHLAPIAGSGSANVSGFFCASAELTDGLYAVTVGPQSVELANQLASLVPTRMVAPAVGKVRPDLQGRASGIYLVDDEATGPYTLRQTLARFPAVLRLPEQGDAP